MSNHLKREKQYSLILLAGGKSSRMGTNKAELVYQGKTFVQALLSKAEVLGIKKTYISGFEEAGVETVWDIFPEIGPLGGLHACMKQAKTPYCLVLPVDVPQIPVRVLEELLHFHELHEGNENTKKLPLLLRHGKRRENLIGIYPSAMADYIEERICSRKLSVHGMLDSWGNICFETEVSERQVENINTKEAYEHLLEMSKEE